MGFGGGFLLSSSFFFFRGVLEKECKEGVYIYTLRSNMIFLRKSK